MVMLQGVSAAPDSRSKKAHIYGPEPRTIPEYSQSRTKRMVQSTIIVKCDGPRTLLTERARPC